MNDGISMVQIMDGAYDEVTSILQRTLRDMAVQAANGSLSATEKGYLDTEQDKLALAINTALDQAKFANQDLAKATNASTVVTIRPVPVQPIP